MPVSPSEKYIHQYSVQQYIIYDGCIFHAVSDTGILVHNKATFGLGERKSIELKTTHKLKETVLEIFLDFCSSPPIEGLGGYGLISLSLYRSTECSKL